MKAAKGLTEEQLMAIAAKDNAAVAAALKEKYGAQKAAEMMEQRLRDQQAFVDRMQQMEDRTMDRMERISGKSLEQMGYTAATRATPERSGTGTTVVAPGFGAPVVVTPGGASAPQPPQTPPKKVVICPRCNAELDPSEKFCNSCGAKVQ
jgi:hypothetical protein